MAGIMGSFSCRGGGGHFLGPLQAPAESGEDPVQAGDLGVVEIVHQVRTHRVQVVRGGLAQGQQPGGGEHRLAAPPVLRTGLPGHQTTPLHGRDLVGQPAGGEDQAAGQLAHPQPMPRHLGEQDEHVVVGEAQPAGVAQVVLKPGEQPLAGLDVGPPRAQAVVVQALGHVPTIAHHSNFNNRAGRLADVPV
ncbi:hypothetical protein Jiend_08050 [Micromonospora endophytica]|nr:hypothetical protein Jiend_08050 [Micromonospora endophytica]